MKCFVYILQCNDDSYYTGLTQNIIIRLLQHNKGYSKSTRHKRPLTIKYLTLLDNRTKARALEVRIKKMGAKKYLNLIKFNPKYKETYPAEPLQ